MGARKGSYGNPSNGSVLDDGGKVPDESLMRGSMVVKVSSKWVRSVSLANVGMYGGVKLPCDTWSQSMVLK
jgi:hypothetical protein